MTFNNIIKTRFAPSPTGFTHIGNIRTALFSWLYAKKMNGKFYIRIDDTDRNRSSKIYINNVLNTLTWLGLKSKDEIVFQSNNNSKYKKFINILLEKKKAYKCFCSKERLIKLREKQIKAKKNIKYDGLCQNRKVIKDETNFVVRFNNIKAGYTSFNDEVKGTIKISNTEMDDFIIAKNNYMPTYNLASTIDDIDMKITDIIRGEDHIPNTPKQINIMKALNAKIPRFIHLPLILDKNKNVLSKRNKDISINFYKQNGILPQALLNYIVRLGWSYKNKEIFSLKEMIDLFNIKNINKSAIIIDREKLLWLNRHYIRRSSVDDIFKYIIPIEKDFSLNYNLGPSIKTLINFSKTRVNTVKEIITNNFNLYKENIEIDINLIKMYFSKIIINALIDVYKTFKQIDYIWTLTNIKMTINNLLNKYNIKLSEIAIPLRIIIMGKNVSMPIYEIILITGRILILKKIINIIKKMGL